MRGIARLARELGVSTATVSRALNGNPNVNEETRRKVLETAQRLGYAANQAARSLAQGVTHSVGFMIELDPESTTSTDYFFMGVVEGMQAILAAHGLDLLVLPCAKSQDNFTFLQRFVSRGAVDGLVLAETRRIDRRIDFLQSSGIPFVTLGRSDSGGSHSWIDLDFEGVMATAVERLVGYGHRRIAVTLPSNDANYGVIFAQAYRDNLARHGLEFDEGLVFSTRRQEDDGDSIVDSLVDRSDPATAIILFYEVTAIGIYRRLAERGLKPGRDLSIIGFRGEESVRFLTPQVTCFQMSLQDLGTAAARALLAQMPLTAPAFSSGIVQCRVPLSLVPGESDGPAFQRG
ncbi:Catabolite control protein A [Pleomorphomonas sp. T1.2MG-36]|uniref:substrate-binding domain-containing protein n=1 Tax=Pleomorphomonas sp. T1.2MG-36 TaxID=3041167 RepID=UPI0024776820|nr:substrate-binding domain-containing protein [Pleomorphomonas sp. T1.2MG-36]CAI9414367.1 Catabolite control protein A [Pleomorphomonas sp. T1.2MG-36]